MVGAFLYAEHQVMKQRTFILKHLAHLQKRRTRISFSFVLSQIKVRIDIDDTKFMLLRLRERMDAQEGSVRHLVPTTENDWSVSFGQQLVDHAAKHGLRGFHFLSATDNIAGIMQDCIVPMKGQVA